MKATAPSCLCSTHRRPLNTNGFAPSLPHLLLSPPPLVLPDEGRFALSGASIRHKGEGFVRKALNFCDKLHYFHAKVHRFFPLLLAYGSTTANDWGKVHRTGENAPQTGRRIPWFLRPRWVFFLLIACSRRKRPVGAKERARADESVDEAVRKHGRKGVGTRGQKSAGRRELNVCRREDEALWAKRRLSREPSPSRRGG